MPRKILRKKDEKIPTHKEMTDAWWSIYNAFEHIRQEKIRDHLTRISFEALLAQCGWTIEEWNSITNKK